MNSKNFTASIDVVNSLTGDVLCNFNYTPLLSGDYERARKEANYFVRDYCERHKIKVSSFEFIDHYHCSCWFLD